MITRAEMKPQTPKKRNIFDKLLHIRTSQQKMTQQKIVLAGAKGTSGHQ
jgi:hypothetical protein